MSRKLQMYVGGAFALMMPIGVVVHAQELPDTQTLTNRLLFKAEDIAAQRRRIEAFRIDVLGEHAKQQDKLIQQQALTLSNLRVEVTNFREEQALIGVADAFEENVVDAQWTVVRQFLADEVSVKLEALFPIDDAGMSAEAFILKLTNVSRSIVIASRSDQHVRIEGARATLISKGPSWTTFSQWKVRGELTLGVFEYGFHRTAEGWRINSILFRASK